MFDTQSCGVGLLSGENDRYDALFDDLVYQLTRSELAEEWVSRARQIVPSDLDQLPPGPYLAAVVDWVERCDLNGYDLVRVMQARERLVSHFQAGAMADAVEISYCAPGDSHSPA